MSKLTFALHGHEHALSYRKASTLESLARHGEVRADILTAQALALFAGRGWCEHLAGTDAPKVYILTPLGREAAQAMREALAAEKEPKAPEPAPEPGTVQLGLPGSEP